MLENGEVETKGVAHLAKRIIFSLRRLFPAYLLSFVPFLVFGEKGDFRLMLWKIAVVGAGLLILHFARKSMFPYIDLNAAYRKAADADDSSRMALAIIALAQSIVVAVMAGAILLSVAGGI